MTEDMKLPRVRTGILGGTGLYEIEGISNIREINLDTPFGKPSDSYVLGTLEGREVVFLTRHGRGHRILPSEINYRANICGFKMLGVERIISVTSVGSLKEEIRPQDIVFADQFFDRTHRKNTFFGEGVAAHIGFADPVCSDLSQTLFQNGKDLGYRVHQGGVYICIEGPSFSSKAESRIYRQWGCDVIGMTAATEARLCREAEICYAAMNLVTDYDVWHESEEGVSVELILENLQKNIGHAKTLLKKAVAGLSEKDSFCGCTDALKNTIVTRPELISESSREKLRFIIGKYIS